MSSKLVGRAAIITGASQGLGAAMARSFVQEGASVLLCARDEARLREVKTGLEGLCQPGQRVEIFGVDVSRQDEVQQLVQEALRCFPQVHILVNNAGLYGPKGRIETVDWDEWAKAIQINLMGSVLTARSILPHLRAQHHGKIIQLSGGGATAPMPFISAYAASKAGIVRLMETLAQEVKEDGIDVNSIAPGALNTRMLDEVLEAGPEKVGEAYYQRCLKQKREGGASLENASELAVFLASEASNGITGKLISAVWDPWQEFPEHLKELQESDIYTLRRIVPKDRGQTWGEV